MGFNSGFKGLTYRDVWLTTYSTHIHLGISGVNVYFTVQ